MSELENARLVRLLCKFGFINERPEYAEMEIHILAWRLIDIIDLRLNLVGRRRETDTSSNYSVTTSFIKSTRTEIRL